MADAMCGVAETPLQYLLRRIPRDAIYQWTTPETEREVWQLASNSAPIGRLAHEAADRLDKAASPPAREEARAEGAGEPVAVTIFCPVCALPHVDEGEWATTRKHKTHQCQGCGHEWRPFPFATVGVTHPARAALNEGGE